MGIPFLHKISLVLLFLSCYCNGIAGTITLDPSNGEERDALESLKATLNHPFLNENWTGTLCSTNPPGWYGIQCTSSGQVEVISLDGIGLTGSIHRSAFKAFTDLSVLNLRNNSITGSIMDFSSNEKLRVIDLSGNNLHGHISQSLLYLDFLQTLQLQNNSLMYLIPELNQTTLTSFNVSYNNLQGEIPRTVTLQSFRYDSYLNNPGLCGPPSSNLCNTSKNESADTNRNNSPPSKRSGINSSLILFMLFDIVGLAAVLLLFALYYRKAKKLKKLLKNAKAQQKRQEEKNNEEGDDDCEEKITVSTEPGVSRESRLCSDANVVIAEETGKLVFMNDEGRFDLNDLLKSSAQALGKGIFGNTYKATMEGRIAVVVKRLRDLKPLTVQEFARKVYTIANLKHPNLLPLLAYFYSKDEKLLVYKYAVKGNLFNRIHGAKGNGRTPLRWRARLSIARGIVRGLFYLHHSDKSQSVIPHGNLKSSNVLLDENEMVLVSDYGLTSLISAPIAAQHMICYKSPEYQTVKKVSKKSDVWSYGCLLLELLTGKIPAHSAPQAMKGMDLCSWIHQAVREEWTNEIFDSEISAQSNATSGMLRLLQIAIRCCDKSVDKRPEITEVLREVESIKVAESEDEDDQSIDQSLINDSGFIAEERLSYFCSVSNVSAIE